MAVSARVGAPFDLKSTSLSGLALVLRTGDAGALAAAMAERFGDAPGVFNHEPVVIDLSALPDDAGGLDFAGLLELLGRHRLRAVGIRGGSGARKEAALEAGLGDVADDSASAPIRQAPVAAVPSPATRMPADAAPDDATPAPMDASSAPLLAAPVPADPAPVAAGPRLASPTLIVDKPLRSGQQVYAKGGDLVVLATVNVGAEVIADGSIHVYGPLRGKAVAGAKGNVEARIFSTCMEPQLLAIAGTYRTTETPLPEQVLGRAAQIRLDGERLVFEPLD